MAKRETRHAPEIKQIPRVDEVNRYLDESIEAVKAQIAAFSSEHRPDWEPLNQLFLDVLYSR